MINFGRLIKQYRKQNSISQNEFSQLVGRKDKRLSGLDGVTISRWENGTVTPTHRRQIEVFNAIDINYYNYILENVDLLDQPYHENKLTQCSVWENSISLVLEDIKFQEFKTVDSHGNSVYGIVYSDLNDVSVGQITYRYYNKAEFFEIVGKRPISDDDENKNDSVFSLHISSMFCLTDSLLPHMLGTIINKFLIEKIKCISFTSTNKRSNLRRFFKCIGFNDFTNFKGEKQNAPLFLTYHDALYNKELFHCTIFAGINGESSV